jgi:hypothetical protein
MNTFTTEELDREEIEFLPSRIVMTTCSPNPCCRPCGSTIEIYATIRVGCFVRCDANVVV